MVRQMARLMVHAMVHWMVRWYHLHLLVHLMVHLMGYLREHNLVHWTGRLMVQYWRYRQFGLLQMVLERLRMICKVACTRHTHLGLVCSIHLNILHNSHMSLQFDEPGLLCLNSGQGDSTPALHMHCHPC